ncbi:MAG: YdcF family protein [Campylobacterales bacterium]
MSTIFILSKLFTYLFLPPSLFIWPLVWAGWVVKRYRSFFIASALLLWIISAPIVGRLLLEPLERPYRTMPDISGAKAVVILGGGSIAAEPTIPLAEEPMKRLLWGMVQAREHNLTMIYSGGSLRGPSGARQAYKTARMIDPRLLLSTTLTEGYAFVLEEESKDTVENARLTKRFFTDQKPKIVLVTSAYHMRRSMMIFTHEGFDPLPCATDFKVEEGYLVWDFFPSMEGLKLSYAALHEYAGILSLKLRGF